MFRKFKGLMALFAIICVTAIAGGSAYFYFGGYEKDRVIENTTDDNEVKTDNILENYEFGNDKDLNETYTYYFFPSTLYMSDTFYSQTVKPENVFGYNEVILDDNGDPVLDSNNQPQYKIVQDGRTGINNYLSYHDYLTNYLNYESESYLNSNPLALSMDDHGIKTSYSYSNKGISNDKDSANGNVYTYGISVGGDDSHVQGYSTSMKDPYILNNTKLSSELLLNNVKFSNYKKGNKESYNVFYYLKKDFDTTIEYADEVLSPIYYEENSKNKTYDISLGLDDKKIELINAYADYYQHGSNSRLNSNSLTVTSDDGQIHYKGSLLNPVYIQETFRDHSPFYNNPSNHELHCFSLEEIEDSPWLGTWFGTNSKEKTIVFAFLNNGRGYLYDFDSFGIEEFDYSVSDSDGSKNISFETDGVIWGAGSFSGTLKLNTSDPTSQMVNRAQYRNDRFGFWTAFYDWDDPKNSSSNIQNSASRYLPIKITVNGNLTPDDMAKVIPTLSASMFDNNMWADFSANVWTYVPYTYNSESKKYEFKSEDKEYTTEIGGFTAKDITKIFDIMQNPSKYADGDNVIRLFPVFSNGKNAGGNESNGGSDAIQANFTYTEGSDGSDGSEVSEGFSPNITNDLVPSSTKMTYSATTYESTEVLGISSSYYINYAVLKNVEITKNKFEQLTFRIDLTSKSHNWPGDWVDVYKFSGGQLDSFIETYGEGLYTFYLIIGNRARSENIGSSTPFNGVNVINAITNSNSTNNELYGKHLLPLNDSNSSIVSSATDGYKFAYSSKAGIKDYSRPVALAVEKVTNLRLVSDIPIVVDDDGEASDDQEWGSIDGNIQQGLLNAKNFTIADEVYGFDTDIYKEDNIDLNSGTRLDTNNPYIYVIQNADFRFVNNLYFQIRFSNDYIKNAMNVTTDYSLISTNKPKKYVAYSVNGQILKFKFQDSDYPDNDVFIQNASAGSGENARQGFKLKDYNARGIYDILLVSHGTSGNSQQYYMYVNRHTNSFIKLFYGNPGTFEFTSTGSTEQQKGNSFVRHKLPTEDTTEGDTQTRDKDSTLLWNGQTYLGEYLTTSTTGTRYSRDGDNEEQVDPSSDASLYAAIRDKCRLTPGEDNVYKIIDAVTGRVVAYYNSGVGRIFTSEGSTGSGDSSDAINLFTIMKNYVLYIDPDPIQ